jgi:RNA-directed DNA polymerase
MTAKGKNKPDKVDALRQKLYQKAKNERSFRFYTLYSHVYRIDVLKRAWQQVKRNGGSAGVDGVGIAEIELAGTENFLKELEESLRARKYKAQAVRRVHIAKLALQSGKREVYDIDMQGYFDSIPHDKLMKCVEMRISDGKLLKLIRMWLKAAIVEEDDDGKKHSKRSKVGTPQGGVISPLLSNIYLHWFDKVFYASGGPAKKHNASLVRYADDMLIMSEHIGADIKDFVEAKLETWMSLKLNREKSRVVKIMGGNGSVDFLGYTFRLDRDLKGRSKFYINVEPSAKALKRERARIKEMTSSHYCFKPIPELIRDVNKHLACWTPYYSFGYPRKAFRTLDEYVRRRLILHLKRRSQRPFQPSPGVTWYEQLTLLGYQRL